MKDFHNKVAAITGAGSGIGRALAESLARRGCHLAIADIDEAGLAETADRIANENIKVTTHLLDVGNQTEVERYASAAGSEHGKINLIFNNAGVSATDSVEHFSYEDFEWLMKINFWGVVYGTKSFLPWLQQATEAHIVNTSSIFGIIAVATQSAYNASKFAVRGFTYALRQELAESHIGVSCVQPGGVKTNIVKKSRYVPRDNSAPTREEFISRFDEIAGLTPNQAAEQILRGVLKNKAQILVGRDARLMALLERIAPVGYHRFTARVFS